MSDNNPTIVLPLALVKQIEEVLTARQFIVTEDDEDNDYEVLNVLHELRKHTEQT